MPKEEMVTAREAAADFNKQKDDRKSCAEED